MLKCRTEYNTKLDDKNDAIFEPDYPAPGSVIMYANVKGRQCIDNMFPNEPFSWSDRMSHLSDDWRACELKVEDIFPSGQVPLPLICQPIPPGLTTLVKSTSGQAALLLALGVQNSGGCATIIDCSNGEDHLRMFPPD
jgi:hypothetical protein